MTLLAGFMIAESAEMGLLIGLALSFMSIITTCDVSPTFSRTQMNLSDSIVTELKLTLLALIPTAVSCPIKKINYSINYRDLDNHDGNTYTVSLKSTLALR